MIDHPDVILDAIAMRETERYRERVLVRPIELWFRSDSEPWRGAWRLYSSYRTEQGAINFLRYHSRDGGESSFERIMRPDMIKIRDARTGAESLYAPEDFGIFRAHHEMIMP